MILLQEGQTVEFSPVFEPRLSALDKFFAFYLLFVMVFTVMRCVSLLLNLRHLRKLEESKPLDARKFEQVWSVSSARVKIMRRVVALTLLFDLTDLSQSVANSFLGVATEKSTNIAVFLPELGSQLTKFTAGLFICLALYACSIVFESRLIQRRLSFERTSTAIPETLTD